MIDTESQDLAMQNRYLAAALKSEKAQNHYLRNTTKLCDTYREMANLQGEVRRLKEEGATETARFANRWEKSMSDARTACRVRMKRYRKMEHGIRPPKAADKLITFVCNRLKKNGWVEDWSQEKLGKRFGCGRRTILNAEVWAKDHGELRVEKVIGSDGRFKYNRYTLKYFYDEWHGKPGSIAKATPAVVQKRWENPAQYYGEPCADFTADHAQIPCANRAQFCSHNKKTLSGIKEQHPAFGVTHSVEEEYRPMAGWEILDAELKQKQETVARCGMAPAESPRHDLDTQLDEGESIPYPSGKITQSLQRPPTSEPASAPQEQVHSHPGPGKPINSLWPTDRDEAPHSAAQCAREDDWEDEEDWNEDDGAYHPCHDREEVDHPSWPGENTEWPVANYRVIFTVKIVREGAKKAEKTETREVNFDIISAPTQAVGGRAGTCHRPDSQRIEAMTEVDYITLDPSAYTYRVLH